VVNALKEPNKQILTLYGTKEIAHRVQQSMSMAVDDADVKQIW